MIYRHNHTNFTPGKLKDFLEKRNVHKAVVYVKNNLLLLYYDNNLDSIFLNEPDKYIDVLDNFFFNKAYNKLREIVDNVAISKVINEFNGNFTYSAIAKVPINDINKILVYEIIYAIYNKHSDELIFSLDKEVTSYYLKI
ncbi:MAG: hypothetical protein QXW35_05635 [Candidatus Aenigmatarchaeota archaeon]